MSRTIIFGDWHGCPHVARALLAKIGVTVSDRVIIAGDLLDRGPDSAGAVDLAMGFEAIRGNHEENHLKKRAKGVPLEKMSEDHARAHAALRPEHWTYLESLPYFIEVPEHNAVVVHAGVVPDVPLSLQDPNFLLRGQMLAPPDNRWGYFRPTAKTWWPGREPEGIGARFWTEFYKGPSLVVFGHTVLSAPLVTPFAIGIDTGCVFGRSLSALILPSREIVSVPAPKAYYPGRELNYPIGDVFASGEKFD